MAGLGAVLGDSVGTVDVAEVKKSQIMPEGLA